MLNMGILGMGKMGEFHADWIIRNRDMRLVALCKKRKDRVEDLKKRYGVDVYLDVDEFLAINEMDWVVITSTNEVHEELTLKALEKKKNVIVEKPMSVNFQSALKMVKAAERNKKHLFVHQSSRWDRDYLLVRDTIRSGLIGELKVIQSKVILCDEGWPAWGIDGMKNPWRIKAQYYGGMILDWGPHLVDQMLQIMGEDPIGVFGKLQKGVWSDEVDDHFFALLAFKNGVLCHIEASNNGRIPLPRWYVIGTKGTIAVTGKSEPFWDEAEVIYVKANGKKESQKFKLYGVCESGMEGGFYEDLVPFLKGEIKEFVSMYETANAMKVLDMIRKASEENRYIEF